MAVNYHGKNSINISVEINPLGIVDTFISDISLVSLQYLTDPVCVSKHLFK